MRSLWRRPTSAPGSEDFAWACLVVNLAGMPGLGTLMARQWEAVPQILLAAGGGVLLTWWLVAFLLAVLRTLDFPPPGGPALALLVWGVGLFAVAWVWALASSLAQLRASARGRRSSAPPSMGRTGG